MADHVCVLRASLVGFSYLQKWQFDFVATVRLITATLRSFLASLYTSCSIFAINFHSFAVFWELCQ